MLNQTEIEFFDRQIKLADIGEEGQLKLKNAKVLVIGAGGLGCPALRYLATIGVGKIGIVDFDTVSISNLHRQILFDFQDVNKNKAEVAKEKLLNLSPFVNVSAYKEGLNLENAISIVQPYDFVLDCTDNMETRYLLNDTCVLLNKPFVYASLYKFEAQLSIFNFENGPTYRCIFPYISKQANVVNCNEQGTLSIIPGIIGLYQANEAVKMILQIGEVLSEKLMLFNFLKNTHQIIKFSKRNHTIYEEQKLKGLFQLEEYGSFCSSKRNEFELTYEECLDRNNLTWIDIRENYEEPKINVPFIVNIPFGEMDHNISLLEEKNQEGIVFFCESGNKSLALVYYLKEKFNLENIYSLKEGMTNKMLLNINQIVEK